MFMFITRTYSKKMQYNFPPGPGIIDLLWALVRLALETTVLTQFVQSFVFDCDFKFCDLKMPFVVYNPSKCNQHAAIKFLCAEGMQCKHCKETHFLRIQLSRKDVQN